MTGICPDCGAPLDDYDQHLIFSLPNHVIDAGMSANSDEVWMDGATPAESDFLAARGVGCFLRAVLPVRLSEGFAVTYGVWLAVDESSLQRASTRWGSPSYGKLVIEGRLANRIAPWEIYGAEVTARPRNPHEYPYCVASPDPAMQAVLTDVWPHELVLSTLTNH